MTYQDENDIIGNNALQRMFFDTWHYTNKVRDNFDTLELDIDFDCNLACKYCYVHRYGDVLYPKELKKNGSIIRNTKSIIKWLIKNELNPSLALFSGEPFANKIGFDVMDMIYEIYKDAPGHLRPRDIIVPTNFTFLLSDKLTKKVDILKQKFTDIGIQFILSASIEGKYMKSNRPYKNSNIIDMRDDSYYDKVFSYCSKNHYGFHPMVYSNNIENWIKNFLWFQDMFKKHKIPPFAIYLLEVRNMEWTDEQIMEFQKFYDFLIKYLFDLVERDKYKFIDYIYSHKGFNIISSPLTNIGRGLGCSIQSTLYVRLGDLKIFPCHRTFYKQFQTAEFKLDSENNIIGINCINSELMLSIYSFQSNIAPYCERCVNKYMCSKGCLGAQFEATGDLFTPIPTVCTLEFAKSIQLIKTLKELDILNTLKENISENILENIELIEGLINTKGVK